MVVNFRACEISRGARKQARTPTLNKKKNLESSLQLSTTSLCYRKPGHAQDQINSRGRFFVACSIFWILRERSCHLKAMLFSYNPFDLSYA